MPIYNHRLSSLNNSNKQIHVLVEFIMLVLGARKIANWLGRGAGAAGQCAQQRRLRSEFRCSRPLIYILPSIWVNNCPRSAPPSTAIHLATPNHCSPNI